MPEMNLRAAIREALKEEMAREPRTIVMGEDVGAAGGVFKVTQGLFEQFGEERVRDTPISETAIVGCAVGAAVTGLKPIVEIMFADFNALCVEQIGNLAAKYRYLSGGQVEVPIVIRSATGAGIGFGAQHSQNIEAWFMQTPGIKIAVPSTPYDAKGLMKSAIRGRDPVLFLEHKLCYPIKGDVPSDDYEIPFGLADIKRKGSDVTIIATMLMVHRSLLAAKLLEESEGISAEVLDLRTLVPLDAKTILASIGKTRRVVIVEENPRPSGWGAEIASVISEKALYDLEAPIVRISAPNSPVPYSPLLEKAWMPDENRILSAAKELVRS
ncbi:MAG TPA: alpha-ketoacid dehydrogenase subunit beta [Nitrososphaerales archaeon]|nr:alpha-ketoacid dehydrogenase subunit beta [Nitrososphaerales archaeon]